MEDLISIIVPVYNVESYIEKCVCSILKQTYHNFELLLIDDGSKDNSGEICEKLALKDDRIKVYHQANSGVSAARNLGINKMQGKYCTFVDSDDTIQQDFLEVLYRTITYDKSQMSCCSYSFVWENGVSEVVKTQIEGLASKDEAMRILFRPFGYRGYLCNKLMLVSVIRDSGIRLNEKLTMMEDLDFCVKYLSRVSIVSFIDKSLYNYFMRGNSACHTLALEHKIMAFEVIMPIVEEKFDELCLGDIRWSYYTGLLSEALKKRKILETHKLSVLLEKIKHERRYFMCHPKYSLMGFLRKVLIEMYLQVYRLCKK